MIQKKINIQFRLITAAISKNAVLRKSRLKINYTFDACNLKILLTFYYGILKGKYNQISHSHY